MATAAATAPMARSERKMTVSFSEEDFGSITGRVAGAGSTSKAGSGTVARMISGSGSSFVKIGDGSVGISETTGSVRMGSGVSGRGSGPGSLE